MQALLEYIKKTKTSDYSAVSLCYSNNHRVTGILIHGRDHDFVLDTNDYINTDFESVLSYQDHTLDGWRLGTGEEWEDIGEHLDEINELLKECGGDQISSKKVYWTGEKDRHERYMALVFETYLKKVRLASIYNKFTIRAIKKL